MEIKLSKWQTKVWDDTSRFKVINIGRRGGKTSLVVFKIIDFAANNNNTSVWFVAPTYKQAKLIAWEMFKEFVPEGAILKTNETELVIYLKNGSSILLKGADNPNSLRGVRIDFCVFDEVAFIDKWKEVWKVMRPTLVDSKAECWFISTPNGFNHFWDLYNNPDYKSFHFTSFDNPYIDRNEINAARKEMVESGQEDTFFQEFMGEFRKMSGLVYKTFARGIHMVDVPQLTDDYIYMRALDFGFAHKTALGYFAVAPDLTAIYMYDGTYQDGLTTPQLADIIRVKDGSKIISNAVADSAQPILIQELYDEGISFEPVEKGSDSVKNGIVKVANLLKIREDTGKPTLMFDKSLMWVAEEFESYRWMENKSAENALKEAPRKLRDDACFVAGTLIATNKGEIPIEEIKDGDFVSTPSGYAKVLGCGTTGKTNVYNYGVFTSTKAHRILTNRGMVRVDSLRYNDLIWQEQKERTFREFLIDAILTQKTEHIKFTFNALLTRSLEVKLDSYTGMYGYTIRGRFLRAMRYIILMVMLPIMKSVTLRLSHMLNMPRSIIGGVGMALKNIRKKLLVLPENGGSRIPKKLEPFTRSLLRKRGQPGRRGAGHTRNALFVGRNIKHTSLVEAGTAMQIVRPQLCGEEEVYNLATDNGMYFANGILVSNCDMIRYFAMTYTAEAEEELDYGLVDKYVPNITRFK